MKYVGNILYDEDLLRDKQEIIIFGAGMYGKKILHYLERNGVKKNVAGFCDSDEKIQGIRIENIPVYHVNEAWIQHPEAVYLICGRYMEEMYQTLKEKGIDRIHMLFF